MLLQLRCAILILVSLFRRAAVLDNWQIELMKTEVLGVFASVYEKLTFDKKSSRFLL